MSGSLNPNPIRIGVVGLSKEGWASLSLIPPLLQPPLSAAYSLTALLTTSEASASESAKKYSELAGHDVKAYHGNTSQIGGDENVDLVAVSVKVSAHKRAVIPAIEKGKDVFVEWPAGNGMREVTEIARLARKKGVRTMVGLQGRLSPAIQKLKELVASGTIGKILSTSVIAMVPREIFFWGPWLNERNAYTADVAFGATLLDVAVGHFLDSFTYVLGDITSLSATTAKQYPTATLFDATSKPTGAIVPVSAPDHIAFTGVLNSGAVASVTWRGGLASTVGRKQFIWEIDGEDGSIRVENDALGGTFVQAIEPKLYLNGELVTVDADELPNNSARAWQEFARTRAGEGEVGRYATLDDAVRVHRVIDAIKKSAREGRRVDVDTGPEEGKDEEKAENTGCCTCVCM